MVDEIGAVAGKLRRSATALLLIDLVNPMDFAGGDALFVRTVPAAKRIAVLARRARDAGIPVIYVNDNFDCWHLGFRELVDRCRERSSRARHLIELLEPNPPTDHFVLKPLHSAFFRTGLETLLERLEARTLILTGVAAEVCVSFTANDAHMRGYRLVVPADCVASEREEDEACARRLMESALRADVRPSTELDLAVLTQPAIAQGVDGPVRGG